MDPLGSRTDQSAVPSLLPAAPPKHRRFSRTLLAVMLTLLVIMLCFIAGVVRYGGTPISPQEPPPGLRLHSISMVTPDEGWAVGDKPRSKPDTDAAGAKDLNAVEPIILHYKGGHWTQDQLPTGLNPYNLDMTLSDVSMASTTEGWAVGSTLLPRYPPTTINGVTSVTIVDGITVPVLLHYTGGKWVLIQNPPAAFASIVMRSANDGWAIGQGRSPDPYGAMALHYNGTSWATVSDPAFASFVMQQLAVAPDGEVWITGVDYSQPGYDSDQPAAILHYDGSKWTREPISLANDRLLGLAIQSPGEGWAVGYDPGRTLSRRSGPQQGLIVHYHDGVWEQQGTIASPSNDTFFYLSAVAMVSADEGWAVGQDGVIVHYLNGTWARVKSPTSANLSSVTMVSASEGWAVGDAGTILHYQHGAWGVYRG